MKYFMISFSVLLLFSLPSYAGMINFDFWADGTPINIPAGTATSINSHYSSLGVIFSTPVDTMDPSVIRNTYWSYSHPNILSSTSSPDPDPDYNTGIRQTPIVAHFVDPVNGLSPATTDQVSIVAIMNSGDNVLPLGSVALIGYDIYGNVIATATNTIEMSYIDDPISEVLTIQAPGIASVIYDMDVINDGFITSGALDDFTYNALVVVPEPISPILFITGWAVFGCRRYLRKLLISMIAIP